MIWCKCRDGGAYSIKLSRFLGSLCGRCGKKKPLHALKKGATLDFVVDIPVKMGEVTEFPAHVWPWEGIMQEECRDLGFYIAEMYESTYMVMPCYWFGDARMRFYSARKMFGKAWAPRYTYPKGVKKVPYAQGWPSPDQKIILCEGVGDALACSRFGFSVALLGTNYLDILNALVYSKEVDIVFDNDFAGNVGAMKIAQRLSFDGLAGSARIISLPEGTDPPSCEYKLLKELLQ